MVGKAEVKSEVKPRAGGVESVVLVVAVAVWLVCSNVKTIKGDLIPYLVQQQFTDKKPSVPSDDTNWGMLVSHLCLIYLTV